MAFLLCGGLMLAPLLASRLNRSPATDVMEVDDAAAVPSRSKSGGPRSVMLLRLIAKQITEPQTTGAQITGAQITESMPVTVPAATSSPAGAPTLAAPPKASPPPLLAPAATSTTAPSKPVRAAGRRTDTGAASWYQTYDGTCAHRSLAKGTTVRVVNVLNGKVAKCRVADRGPYLDGRIIDLDLEIFEQLADSWRGVIEVRISW